MATAPCNSSPAEATSTVRPTATDPTSSYTPPSSTPPDIALTNTYDGLDRIAIRTHGGSYNFLYNGVEKEPAYDATSAFARGPDGGLIGAGTGADDWVTLDDAHGDIVAAFTTDGAALTESRSYDPFGKPRTPVSTDLQIGYQGNWTDPDTGLVAAQARWYDPNTATFLTRDTYPPALDRHPRRQPLHLRRRQPAHQQRPHRIRPRRHVRRLRQHSRRLPGETKGR